MQRHKPSFSFKLIYWFNISMDSQLKSGVFRNVLQPNCERKYVSFLRMCAGVFMIRLMLTVSAFTWQTKCSAPFSSHGSLSLQPVLSFSLNQEKLQQRAKQQRFTSHRLMCSEEHKLPLWGKWSLNLSTTVLLFWKWLWLERGSTKEERKEMICRRTDDLLEQCDVTEGEEV